MGDVAQAMGSSSDNPGNHGADQPFVRCPNRIQEDGADPLGPVISHGFKEAPGFTPSLLDNKQKKFLRSASLRTRDDGGPNSILYEDLSVPKKSPSYAEIAHLVTGAIELAGRRLPAPAVVLRDRVTQELDDLGNILPVFRVWTIQFSRADFAIGASLCTLIAPVDKTQEKRKELKKLKKERSALLTCRLPPKRPPNPPPRQFEPFTTTSAQADASALAFIGAPHAMCTVSSRYHIDGNMGLARHYAVTYDGTDSYGVLMDGGATVLDVQTLGSNFRAKGWELDYSDGYTSGSSALQTPNVNNPFDVGVDQTVYLDSSPITIVGARQFGPENCVDGEFQEPSDFPFGFVVCENGVSKDATDPEVQRLHPRPPSNDFTDIVHFGPLIDSGVPDPGLLSVLGPDGAARRPTSGDPTNFNKYRASGPPGFTLAQKKVAAYHWAELQAFYNIGLLQHRYNLMGHPRFCDTLKGLDETINWCQPNEFCGSFLFLSCNPSDPAVAQLIRQDPHRLEITVHWDGDQGGQEFPNNGRAGLNFIKIGDFRNPNFNQPYGVESIGDATLVAHEYQHHIFDSIERDLPLNPFNGMLSREAIEEGLGDAFASVHVGHDYGTRGFNPKTDPDPCANPSNYPPSPQGQIPRHACNSESFGFWLPGTFEQNGEVNRRGSIIWGALFRFQKRIKDGGWGWYLPGHYMYEAQKALMEPFDEEPVFLDQLLALLKAATNGRRFLPHAQLAFEEKGVFPTGGGPVCNVPNPLVCGLIAVRSLAMAGPLNSEANQVPTFDLFAPQGAIYDNNVLITWANNPQFAQGGGNVIQQLVVNSNTQPIINNSPHGFFRLTLPSSIWNNLVANLKSDRRIYYRMRQCQLLDPSRCVVTSLGSSNTKNNSVPFVKVGNTALETGCGPAAPKSSIAGKPRAGSWLLIAALLLLGRRSVRRRS